MRSCQLAVLILWSLLDVVITPRDRHRYGSCSFALQCSHGKMEVERPHWSAHDRFAKSFWIIKEIKQQ